MNESQIIAFMANNPTLSVLQAAIKLEIETLDIGIAQHNNAKRALRNKRDKSAAWSLLDTKEELKWLPKAEFERALIRIEAGQKGILEELQKEYRVSSFYKQVLLSHG